MYKKRLMVCDILSGSVGSFEDLFMIHSLSRWRRGTSGEPIVSMILRDKTGFLRANLICDDETMLADICAKLESARRDGRAVLASGFVEMKGGKVEARLTRAVPLDRGEYESFPGVFSLPAESIELMWMKLKKIAEDNLSEESDECAFGRILLNTLVFQKDRAKLFKEAPGAMIYHHAFIGGLLQHTLRVVETALEFAKKSENIHVSIPLVVVGSILHDVGKIEEYEFSESYIRRTRRGELHGHVILGAMLVDRIGVYLIRKENGRNYWRELLDDVVHIILSHHGRREWGSPIEPALPEAFIVHYADDISAKLDHVLAQLSLATGEDLYSQMLKRRIFESKWGKKER